MEVTKPKTFVFVLMPFSEKFADVYELGIKAACKDAGAYCERVDEQVFDGNILERVYNQIAKADIIIAEMSGRNPNVFYEIGYAHALNKRAILLTQNAEDIPFDLQHFPHIIYGGRITILRPQLETRIRWYIEHPSENLLKVDMGLQFFVNGIDLQEGSAIYTEPNLESGFASYHIDLHIHNPTNRVIAADSYELALLAPNGVSINWNYESKPELVPLPDGQFLHSITYPVKLFPSGWHVVPNLRIAVAHYVLKKWIRDSRYSEEVDVEITLRLFTELAPKDFPIVLKIYDCFTVYQSIRRAAILDEVRFEFAESNSQEAELENF